MKILRITTYILLLFFNSKAIAQLNNTNSWTQNSFPSAKHKAEGYTPFTGEMRGQRVNYFGVSPSNPNFMIMTGNMAGQGFVATNGKDFRSFGTEAGWCGNTFGFSPHNGNLAFALMGTKVYGGTDDANWGTDHPFGIYRAEDTGNTWTQILTLPENIPGDPTSINTTPGQEPIGKCMLLVDPSPIRSSHVYYASGEKGLIRSVANGDKDSWSVVAFANKFVKTISAGVGSDGITHLYAVVADGYSEADTKDGQVYYPSGRLYRIDISANGSLSAPVLCLNGLYNITDVETELSGNTGFAIVDASAASGESTNKGVTWNDIERTVVTDPSSGQPYVPDFVSWAAGQHHMKDYGWAMDYESGRGDQGSAVGFMDSSTVVWMSSSKDRPILKSMDYGATAASFTTGSETKWLNQINTGGNGMLVGCSFGEYGFTLSTDGGESWEGITEFSDDIMNHLEGIAKKDFGSGGASNRAGFAVAFEEGIPLNEPQHAILIASRSGIIVDAWQTGDLATWELSVRGDYNDPQRIYESHKDDGDLVGEAFWVDNYVYLGNFRSKDNGQTFDKLYTEPNGKRLVVLAVSSTNGKVAIATPNRDDASKWSWAIYLTIDGGDTWTALEKTPREKATSLNGDNTWLAPISFKMYCKNRHAIAIDPRTEKDPATGGDLRFLLAGRKGIYEYNDARADSEKWEVHNIGLDTSLHFNRTESVPWMGSVAFDPNANGLVYALQTSDRSSMSDWKNPNINANCIYEGEGTVKPVYMSTDWGVTWTNMDNESLPDMLTVSTLHVSKAGELYVASVNSGYYHTIPKDIAGVDTAASTYGEMSMYPNPATHLLTVEIKNASQIGKTLVFYNGFGKELHRYILNSDKETIAIDNWPTGIYYVNILGTKQSKILVVK